MQLSLLRRVPGRDHAMALQSGDWVRTEAGDVGRVVYISRLTAFVQIEPPPQDKRLKAFLTSTLTKIDPPGGLATVFPPTQS
jgi:hypothetical protein